MKIEYLNCKLTNFTFDEFKEKKYSIIIIIKDGNICNFLDYLIISYCKFYLRNCDIWRYVCVCVGVVTGKLLTFHNITLSFTVCVSMFADM